MGANDFEFSNASALLLCSPEEVKNIECLHQSGCLRLFGSLESRHAMGDDSADEHNDPGDVNPKQKEWRRSKGAVNETVAGLCHDCCERHSGDSEGDRRKEPPDKRVSEGDLAIGYCRI